MTISQQIHREFTRRLKSGDESMLHISRKTGVNKAVLSLWKNNPDRDVTADTLDRLAEYFGLTAKRG